MDLQMRQTNFEFLKDYKKQFGGSLLVGKRKSARPISTKHPLHLVLKSSDKSYFNPTNSQLEKIIRTQAEKYSITIYDYALNWSHIHVLLRVPSRRDYLAFIRTLTALIVAYLSKALGKNLKGLFDLRPFTRVVSWGRDFKRAFDYQTLNQLEALGMITRVKKNKKRCDDFR